MKKNKFLVLLAVLVLGLAACGTKTTDSQKGKNDNKELVAWAWNVNVPVLEEAAEAFKKDHPDFKLKVVEMANEDVYKKMTTGLQAGGKGLPDIVLVEDDRIPGYVNNYPENFLNLSEKGYEDNASKFPEFKMNAGMKDGNFFSMPFDVGPVGVFYRRDIFEKSNINPEDIVTWDDYLEAGEKIKEEQNILLIPVEEKTNDLYYRIVLNQQGDYYFDEAGKPMIEGEKSVIAMETVKKLVDSGLSLNVADGGARISALTNSEVATVIQGSWFGGILMTQAPDLSGKWGVFELPQVTETSVRAANAGGSSFMIPTTGEHVDDAYEFLNFFTTEQSMQEMAMSVGGMYPSLLSAYETEQTAPEVAEYFAGQEVSSFFGSVLENVPATYNNQYMAEARNEMVTAQSKILDGENIKETLKQANNSLNNRMKK